MGSAARTSKPPAKKKQTKITGFTTSVKTKPKSTSRPNASITSYFKKVGDEDLFIGNGVAADVVGLEDEEEEEDIYGADDLLGGGGGSKSAKREDDGRFNEEETPVKRRKLCGGEDGKGEEIGKSIIEKEASPKSAGETSNSPKVATVTASSATTSQVGKRKPQQPTSKKKNPFLDDSDSDDTDSDNDHNGNDVNPEREEVKKKGTSRIPSENNADFRRDGLTFREMAPLLREETSGSKIWQQQESGENGPGPADTADVDQDYGLEEDFGDSFAGEEFREMRFMQEQSRLEAEAAGVDYEEPDVEDTSLMEESCPICNGSLAGVSESQATAHVNACLDGNPTPLPTTSPSSAEKTMPKSDKDNIDSPEVATRSAKAAIPRPGQAIPFKLEAADSGQGDAEAGSTTSAFAKLMSGHAEDAAWATAAASENSSRGMPAYKRTCPFYKIMPNNFSICVDAFRYGAVKDCNAYFLSHFHSDHYIGLTTSWTHGPIYCSKVTGSLVKSQLKTAAKYVVELEFDEKVPVPETNGVFVTMIPANHCPGSSLFLFEKVVSGGRTQRILHCGDFRACPEHIAHPRLRPRVFDTVEKRFKEQKIDVCYLDTTYLNPRYSFPPQNDVIRACAELCVALNEGIGSEDGSRWDSLLRRRDGGAPSGLDGVSKFFKSVDGEKKKKVDGNGKGVKEEIADADADTPPKKEPNAFTAIQNKPPNRNRLLVICGTYSIGKERICIAIAQALKTKIFASPRKIRMCQQLDDPELASLMTSDPREAQVHMQMLMEIRAETLAEYLESYRGHFTKVVGFRPSGWNYSPGSSSPSSDKTNIKKTAAVQKILAGTNTPIKSISANLAPGSVPTTHLLHGPAWRTRFSVKDLTPQRGSGKEAMCFGVPYSEHSSFRELALFLMALRIERVVPTVNVGSEQSRKRMQGWTDRWLAERRRGGVVDVLVEGEGEEEDGGKEVVFWEGKDRKGGGVYW